MDRRLFASLVVAVSLGACSAKHGSSPAPTAPGAPAGEKKDASGKDASGLKADSALPNIDGKWSFAKLSCGSKEIDFAEEKKNNGLFGSIADVVITVANEEMVANDVRTEEREEVAEDGSKQTIKREEITLTTTRIERDAKAIKLTTSGSSEEVWETKDGKRVRLEHRDISDQTEVRNGDYTLKGDEFIVTEHLSDEQAKEDGSLCVDDEGKVLGTERITVYKRVAE